MLVVALFLMRARRISRRLAPFVGIVVAVIAIGFVHRRRREKRAEWVSSAARPTGGTRAVGVVDAPGYQASTVRLRPSEDTP